MQTGNAATFVPVIPAERAGLRPASESRNPVIKAVRAFTPAVDYWVPARLSPVEPGSLGRDDSPYAIALPSAQIPRFYSPSLELAGLGVGEDAPGADEIL